MPDGAAALVRCPRCGESKPPSEFHRHRARRNGLSLICKSCKLEYMEHLHGRVPGPGSKGTMRRALELIIRQVEGRDCELTAETAEICGRIARAALKGEDA